MERLPLELQTHCIGSLEDDPDALKSLRLTSKYLEQLATEVLFKKVILRNDEHSGTRFRYLTESRLNPFVHTAIFTTSRAPGNTSRMPNHSQIAESFEDVFESIPNLQNLKGVQVKFTARFSDSDRSSPNDHFYGPHRQSFSEAESFRSELWELILPAMRQGEGVKALTVKNVRNTGMGTSSGRDDYDAIATRLTELHLQTEGPGDEYIRQYGFPSFWLKPANRQLTHLSLHGGESAWGVWPISDFRDVEPFPQLTSLSLGTFSIAHDWQIDWITAHKSLKKLYLSGSFILTTLLMGEDMAKANFPNLAHLDHRNDRAWEYYTHVDLRWHDIFQRFRTELCLSHFAFGSGEIYKEHAFEKRYDMSSHLYEQRYMMFDFKRIGEQWVFEDRHDFYPSRSTGCNEEIVVRSPCDDEDEEALQSLLEAVERRKTMAAQP